MALQTREARGGTDQLKEKGRWINGGDDEDGGEGGCGGGWVVKLRKGRRWRESRGWQELGVARVGAHQRW